MMKDMIAWASCSASPNLTTFMCEGIVWTELGIVVYYLVKLMEGFSLMGAIISFKISQYG